MKVAITAIILFIVALIPRLIGLDRFLTSDENTNIFIAGSDVIAAFLQGDLRTTYWHFYPGVTLSWLDALGMGGQYLFNSISNPTLPSFTEYIYGDILSLLVANRLPYAVLTAASIPAMYLLARKLLPNRVALFGALFMAFDPFYLAHSRVAHGDAPVTVFMSLSALAYFIYAKRSMGDDWLFTAHRLSFARSLIRSLTDPYLIISAALGSLAALTKAPGQFVALFVIGVSILYGISQAREASRRQLFHIVVNWLSSLIVWGFISLFVFILLWPSMWVDPWGTFRQMWVETFGKVNEGHLVYFFGRPTLDPGFWFYIYVIPFRMTPIVLIGATLSLFLFLPQVRDAPALQKLLTTNETDGSDSGEPPHQTLSPHLLLWLFTLSLLLFGNLSPKKQDRYLLPLFPFLNLLAAMGWLGVISIINYQLSNIKSRFTFYQPKSFTRISILLALLLLLMHFVPVLTYYPYYLTYFNPLMGGPVRAAETTLMGWGEGMEQVAAYLNSKPNAENLYVASTPSQTLLPYFVGTGENFYTNNIAFRADYVVLYLAQMQRLAPSPEIIHYFESQEAEKTITIKDVTYAKIYPGPKFILTDIPPDAVPANIGLDNTLRLAGYKLPDIEPINAGPQLTLYWHALTPISTNYTVSVRVWTHDGRLLTQQDQWPVGGLLPTSQWRQGDYVIDTHTLEIATTESSQISNFEIVVYNADTDETLGPPITIDYK